MSVIERIKIKNFKCFGEEAFEMAFNEKVNIIVGNNEEGKSTILEAIHMVLSGVYRKRPIKPNISQYLFNETSVRKYLETLKDREKGLKDKIPPEIEIELYISEDAESKVHEGAWDSERSRNQAGYKLKIQFDERYIEDYRVLVERDEIISLPIEYYKVEWINFAGHPITSRSCNIRSIMIDSSEYRYYNGTDEYLSRVVKEVLDDGAKTQLAQANRKSKEELSKAKILQDINANMSEFSEKLGKTVTLGANLGTLSEWEKSISMNISGTPFEQSGRGMQCIAKTHLALLGYDDKRTRVILLEEPESHLSYARLNGLVKELNSGYANQQIIITTHSSLIANKMGLDNIILLKNKKSIWMNSLKDSTYDFFKKMAGYDTLRLVLCEKVVLVEGDSDELVFQKAFMNANSQRLPIEMGVDVLSVGTAFERFEEIAEALGIVTASVRDHDGKRDELVDSYKEHDYHYVKLFTSEYVSDEYNEIDGNKYNDNTMEPEIIRANKRHTLEAIVKDISPEKTFDVEDEKFQVQIRKFMKKHKTDVALVIFEFDDELAIPQYICDAVNYVAT